MHQSNCLSEKKFRVLARKLIKAREEERALISKDLHDSVESSLVAVRFLMERIQKESGGGRLEVFSNPGNGTRILAEWVLDT